MPRGQILRLWQTSVYFVEVGAEFLVTRVQHRVLYLAEECCPGVHVFQAAPVGQTREDLL